MDQFVDAKNVARQLVRGIVPDEEDVVDDGFDRLAGVNFAPPARDPSHAFDVPDVWPYALVICAAVGAIFRDAIKDVLKDRIKRLLSQWMDAGPPLRADEIEDVIHAVETQGALLGVPKSRRSQLADDIKSLLTRFPSASLMQKDVSD